MNDYQNALQSRPRVTERLDTVTLRSHEPAHQHLSLDVCRDYWTALDARDAEALRRLMVADVLVEFSFSETGGVQPFRMYNNPIISARAFHRPLGA